MTDYKPGTVAIATVRGQRDCFAVKSGHDFWYTPKVNIGGVSTHDVGVVTDVHPLMVLDIDHPEYVAHLIRSVATGNTLNDLADQIEAQTKPPRIPEPGLWGVVEGWQVGEYRETDLSAFYLREAMDGEADWTRTSDGKKFEWDDITEPILVREGVQS